jgi:hypothetical protein
MSWAFLLQVAGTSTPPFRPLTPQEDADMTCTLATIPQAPRRMQRSGLGRTYRLSREPRRSWRRYLRSNRPSC